MYLGIEIGGTKLQLGLGPGDGTIAALWRGNVASAEGADGIRKQIEGAIPQVLANAKRGRDELKGVGIGFGGPVDDATRTVIKSHQIAGWDGFPLAKWIEEITGLPAVLGNDADVAGLAEALFGAGKGLSPIFYITIGSGIGGGLIINGEIYRGCGRGAAEIGHMKVLEGYSVSFHALVEEVASGWAIENRAKEVLKNYSYQETTDTILWKLCKYQPDSLTAKDIATGASQEDAFCLSIVGRVCWALAEGIDQMISLLCPRRIIIGGGVSLIGEKLLFEPLRQKVAERVFKPFADCYDIVPAALGEEVVVHGALALARKRLSS